MALLAPDIYVIPPAEDSAAPWCCYNSRNSIDDDDDSQSIRYIQASHQTPYFHRTMLGSDGLVLPSRKQSADSQSIVDALGDADEFTDDELDLGPMGIVPEEAEEDDDLGYELGLAHESRPPPEPYSEVGDDSDIIEVFKLRRQSMRAAHTYDDLHETLQSPAELNKSSLRFRATKAFHSLRGAVRPSPALSNTTQDSSKTVATSNAEPLRPRTKLRPKPRVQDIFHPIDNIPQTEKSDTDQQSRRPSSRLARIITPRLRQRPSNIAVTATSPEPSTHSATVSPVFQQEPVRSYTPSQHSSSSIQTQHAFEPDAGSTPNLSQNFQLGNRCFSPPMPHQTLPRSFSPTPVSRSISPVPSTSQASGRFSIRKLQRIFRVKH
ncbi:hypothetical protein Agabi119p4_3538 [Agaricus bisporus var. burnettii]|uniref:Uncharacterized protein n=1 Tax=Agaricus bisporus var. burnettii TaxID=192524 RepID=A0A8H7F589_AGABI|nr:hypothetical protein Agabi119p4_3538 [Agaricus bisporus var. burnettii]